MDFRGDFHTYGSPKPGQDSLLKKDVEAKNFESTGDPFDKMDGKKEGFGVLTGIPGGLTGSQCQAFLGANHSSQFEKQICNTDRPGLPHPGMNISANKTVDMAPFQSTKPPNMAEPEKTSILHGSEPFNPFQAPSKPSENFSKPPESPSKSLDKSAEESGSPWTGQDMFSHFPTKAEESHSKPLGFKEIQNKDGTSTEESTEDGVIQKRQKCDTTEESFGLLESLRSPEKSQSQNSNLEGSSSPGQGEDWMSEIRELGGGRIQAKKSKSRMKLPEEWSSLQNTSDTSTPPDRIPALNKDMNIFTPDMYEAETPSTHVTLPSTKPDTSSARLVQSDSPAASQANVSLQSNKSDPVQSNQGLTASSYVIPNLTAGPDATEMYISHPATKTTQDTVLCGPSTTVPPSNIINPNPADQASLTSLTKEPPQAKSPQIKARDDITVKGKGEDKMDNLKEKSDKPEIKEKTDNSTEKVEDKGKIQELEIKGTEPEKKEKLEKVQKVEEIKEKEKKNHTEKVDKTTKNEKNVKTATGTTKPTTPNGTKSLTSPDSKAMSNKPNATKAPIPSSGQNSGALNSTNKKGPAPKKSTPTVATKKPPVSTATNEAKTSENTPPKRKPPVPKFNTRPSGSSVKSSLKTSPTNGASTPGTDGTQSSRPSRITKPPVPKQVPQPRKPPVVRAQCSGPRPSNAPLPDLKKVSSKIGSTDNIKYQPRGGKVHIVHKKMDFSHITSRCGSKDNIKHVPGGGNVQIMNKKVDLSRVTSKCGSKDNIKHKPGGGNVNIESPKSKTNGNGESKNNEAAKQGENNNKPGSLADPKSPSTQTGGEVKENGLKQSSPVPQPSPSAGEGLTKSQNLDKCIPATN